MTPAEIQQQFQGLRARAEALGRPGDLAASELLPGQLLWDRDQRASFRVLRVRRTQAGMRVVYVRDGAAVRDCLTKVADVPARTSPGQAATGQRRLVDNDRTAQVQTIYAIGHRSPVDSRVVREGDETGLERIRSRSARREAFIRVLGGVLEVWVDVMETLERTNPNSLRAPGSVMYDDGMLAYHLFNSISGWYDVCHRPLDEHDLALARALIGLMDFSTREAPGYDINKRNDEAITWVLVQAPELIHTMRREAAARGADHLSAYLAAAEDFARSYVENESAIEPKPPKVAGPR